MTVFSPYLARWSLKADGAPIETFSSHLLPVLHERGPAMLKVLKPESDEAPGIAALAWFGGEGAVWLLAAEERAVLMERAVSTRSLTAMALAGNDTGATRILADVAARLHTSRPMPPPQTLEPLARRFRSLFRLKDRAPALQDCSATAERLLAEPSDIRVLHGDLHHENVLESPRGWLAIDPKGVLGERTYDFANLFGNPHGKDEAFLTAVRAERLAGELAALCGLDRKRILAFAHAHAGLSACWCIEDGLDPARALDLAAMLATLDA